MLYEAEWQAGRFVYAICGSYGKVPRQEVEAGEVICRVQVRIYAIVQICWVQQSRRDRKVVEGAGARIQVVCGGEAGGGVREVGRSRGGSRQVTW